MYTKISTFDFFSLAIKDMFGLDSNRNKPGKSASKYTFYQSNSIVVLVIKSALRSFPPPPPSFASIRIQAKHKLRCLVLLYKLANPSFLIPPKINLFPFFFLFDFYI